jgi:hypothetical protein
MSWLDDERRHRLDSAKRTLRKATFAEPASATSGLQDYELEGADGKKRPRMSMLAPKQGKFVGDASGKIYQSDYKGEEIEVLPDDVEGMKLQGFTFFRISIR